MQFITGIQQTYGEQYHFTDWFNAIHGVLRFANGDKELRDNKWFKTVDAPILQSIQDGLSIQVNGKVSSKGGSAKAANEWAAFFSYRTFVGSTMAGDNSATIEHSKQLWGAAEIEGTSAGKALAASKGLTAPEGRTLFTDVTDKWREVMSHGPRRTGGIVGTEAGSLFCGQACGFVGGVAGQETFDRFVDPRYEDQTYQMAGLIGSSLRRQSLLSDPLLERPGAGRQ